MDFPSTSTFDCAVTVRKSPNPIQESPENFSPKNSNSRTLPKRSNLQRNSVMRTDFLPQKNMGFLWPSAITLFVLFLSVHNVFCDISEPPDGGEDTQKQLISDGGSGQSDTNTNSFACNEVRYYYNALSRAKGFHAIDKNSIPTKAVSEMESQLSQESSKDYQRVLQDKIIGLRHTFESRASKFDRFFRELLVNSRTDLHKMFIQTYGQFYSQHSEIFIKLFDNLTEYYVRGETDLESVLDGFYRSLYQRMFKIMNPHYSFSPNYWKCMGPMMDRLKPFGDVPQKMKQQVVRSFVAARTFAKALATGRDSIQEIMEVEPVMECSSALMRMMYCPHCRGLPGLKACNNFCLNVMKGCLAHQADLDPDWNAYIDMLLQLLERIEGPFNVESVIDGIDVKISEAIMIFQENGAEVSRKVFDGCGTPDGSSRMKRNSERSAEKFSMEDLRYSAQMYNNRPRPPTAAGTNLERLSQDIKEKIQPVRGFWKNLPYSLCNDNQVAAPAKRDTDCWNGLTRSRYLPSLVEDGILGQHNNPEMNLTLSEPNSKIGQQIMKLRMSTSRMRRAFNGRFVNWDSSRKPTSDDGRKSEEDKEETVEGSGSGDHENDLEETFKASLPMDTDDEDLLKLQETTKSSTNKQHTTTVTTSLPVVLSSDDEDMEDGSGSGDFDATGLEVDWRGTHREKEWEEARRRPVEPPPATPRPKFELPPIQLNTERPKPKSTYDDDFIIGIKAENPPSKRATTIRALTVVWHLLLCVCLTVFAYSSLTFPLPDLQASANRTQLFGFIGDGSVDTTRVTVGKIQIADGNAGKNGSRCNNGCIYGGTANKCE